MKEVFSDKMEALSEDAFVEAYDAADILVEYAEDLDKLRKGKIEVNEFLQTVSPEAVVTILQVMKTAKTDNLRMDAAKDLLDRAGHGKVNKVAVATKNFDRKSSKEELIATIRGFSATSDIVTIEE